jgi:hypothetical protein
MVGVVRADFLRGGGLCMQGGEEGRTYRPLLQKVLGSEMELCVSSKVDQAEGPASGSMRTQMGPSRVT